MRSAEQVVAELAGLARVDNPWGYGEHDEHGAIAVVEADRNAVARVAKLELLEELVEFGRGKMQSSGMSFGSGLVLALYDAQAKYGAAKEGG